MEVVNAEDGVWGCTLVGYCSEVCPKDVDPARAINQNKINSTKDYFLRFLPGNENLHAADGRLVARNPYYLWYMLREASCVFVTVYALVLLGRPVPPRCKGRPPMKAWRESLASPLSLAVSRARAGVLSLYHSWTWFKVMPKTLPFVAHGALARPRPRHRRLGRAAPPWLARC